MLSRFKQSKLFFWTAEIVLTIIGIYFLLQMPNIFKTSRGNGFCDFDAAFDRGFSLLYV